MYHILSHSSDSECVVDLQEVLKMSISILQGLVAEWALLHHVDESWFKFETVISGPSDSNYAHIKAQDKTRTKHIRTRTQSL
jgi:hypothetical protein